MGDGVGLYGDRRVCDVAGDDAIGEAVMEPSVVEVGEGEPILFLHGFMGDRHDFNEVIDRLSDSFRCLSLDLPGHGQAIGNEDGQYGMAETAKTVIQRLEQLGIQQCFLVGYSMGGRLALYLAVHFATRFKKVVLESASPGLKTKAERQARIRQDQQLAARLETENFADFLEQWYRQPLFRSTRFSVQELCDRRLHNQPQELAKSLRHMGTGVQPSLWGELGRGRMLLVVGEWDEKFVEINRQMQRGGAQLEVVPGCGHNVHLEQPGEFAGRVRSFLQTA
jgi:2-succinyl-6-hydroxy-2,4-cyclohexadiene-1-carboxylate synthase